MRRCAARCSRWSSRTSRRRSKFPKLQKAADDLLATKKARKDPKLVKKLAAAAKETAGKLRALDLDRVHIDAVVRELYRAREAALAGGETWWHEGGVEGLRDVRR